jgi:polysaccharide export outer membrane protein
LTLFNFQLSLPRICLVWVFFGLAGCSFAPGVQMKNTGVNSASDGGIPLPQWIRAYEPTTDAGGAYASNGQPAEGALFPITPDLIRLQNARQVQSVDPAVMSLLGVARPYTIGPRDVLSIVVWAHPEMATPASGLGTNALDASGVLSSFNGYKVTAEGLIQFPYVGTVKLGGLTEIEARDVLANRLSKYLKDPQITLQIQAFRSRRIYVEGAIGRPGLQAVNDLPMTLPEVISRAGGLSSTADRTNIALTRDGTTTSINLAQLTESGINPNGIVLRDGDLVRVASQDESKVFVLGEVSKPSALVMRNGHLTLNEALGESGGISQVSGDARQIYVVRSGASGTAEIYHLDARTAVTYALAERFQLKPRDVVFVDPAPLVNFNRVISLLIPSGQLTSTSLDLAKR